MGDARRREGGGGRLWERRGGGVEGGGEGGISTMTTVVSARLSRRSTPRLSRCRTVFPDDAGIGHVRAKEANAASDRTRPGCDHVISTQPATTAPTPGRSHSSGAMSLTAESSAWRLSVRSASSAVIRFANRMASPAGTQRGAFSAGTLDRDGADLSVSQRFTRIDPQIDRPEQCGQRVHSACRSPGHLLSSHNQDPNYLARPRSAR